MHEVFELNVLQSVADNFPVFVALASGIDKVISPLPVTGLPDTETSVPVSFVTRPTLHTVPVQVVEIVQIVSVSLEALVRSVTLSPPTIVKVSVFESATIVD